MNSLSLLCVVTLAIACSALADPEAGRYASGNSRYAARHYSQGPRSYSYVRVNQGPYDGRPYGRPYGRYAHGGTRYGRQHYERPTPAYKPVHHAKPVVHHAKHHIKPVVHHAKPIVHYTKPVVHHVEKVHEVHHPEHVVKHPIHVVEKEHYVPVYKPYPTPAPYVETVSKTYQEPIITVHHSEPHDVPAHVVKEVKTYGHPISVTTSAPVIIHKDHSYLPKLPVHGPKPYHAPVIPQPAVHVRPYGEPVPFDGPAVNEYLPVVTPAPAYLPEVAPVFENHVPHVGAPVINNAYLPEAPVVRNTYIPEAPVVRNTYIPEAPVPVLPQMVPYAPSVPYGTPVIAEEANNGYLPIPLRPLATPVVATPVVANIAPLNVPAELAEPRLDSPIITKYHTQDEAGRYAFGYSGGPSTHHQNRDEYGIVRGHYSYIDSEGGVQTTNYIADNGGFRVAATNLPVGPA